MDIPSTFWERIDKNEYREYSRQDWILSQGKSISLLQWARDQAAARKPVNRKTKRKAKTVSNGSAKRPTRSQILQKLKELTEMVEAYVEVETIE